MTSNKAQVSLRVDGGAAQRQAMKVPLGSEHGQTRVELRGAKARVLLGEPDEVAPDELVLQRREDDLLVMFDGVEPEQAQLLLAGFYEQAGEEGDESSILAGMAENGHYHPYASSVDSSRFEVAQLGSGSLAPYALSQAGMGGMSGLVATSVGGIGMRGLAALGIGASAAIGLAVAGGGGGGGDDDGEGSGGRDGGDVGGGDGGGGGGGASIPNLVDFNQPDFRAIDGSPVLSDLGTGRHGGVFAGGLRFTSYARMNVEEDGSGSSSQLSNHMIMRVNAMRGDMSELTFLLKSAGPVQVSFYDATGQLINTDTITGGASGKTVPFAGPDGRGVAYFTIRSQDSTPFSIDDINYTADGMPALVNFTNAEFKFADGTVATQNFFDTRSVFLGSLEINSSNTMYQYSRNGAPNGGDGNYLTLSALSDTTFMLHKQNVQTVSFDAEFRGDGNVIVFYDANNVELGRIEADRTEGHGGTGQAAKVWEPIRFPSEGASIAYFTVMSGKQQGHGGISIDNISYPQTEGAPTARSMVLSGGQDDVVIDELPELGATGQVPAGDTVQLAGRDAASDAARDKLLALSTGDLIDPGEQDLLVADGGDVQIASSGFDQAIATEEGHTPATGSTPANDESFAIYPAASLEAELLMNGMSSQATPVL